MLAKLIDRLRGSMAVDTAESPEDRRNSIRIATAALLVEVARADHSFDETEFDTLLSLIESHFRLTPEEAALLSDAADNRVEQSVSLHEFTQVLHTELEPADKAEVVAMLWAVAYADGRLDMYEDALVSKIADLLYVPRSELMRLKHLASQE